MNDHVGSWDYIWALFALSSQSCVDTLQPSTHTHTLSCDSRQYVRSHTHYCLSLLDRELIFTLSPPRKESHCLGALARSSAVPDIILT